LVSGWIRSLSSITTDAAGLSVSSKVMLLSLSEDLLRLASSLNLHKEDLEGMETIISLSMSMLSDSSTSTASRRRMSESEISSVVMLYQSVLEAGLQWMRLQSKSSRISFVL